MMMSPMPVTTPYAPVLSAAAQSPAPPPVLGERLNESCTETAPPRQTHKRSRSNAISIQRPMELEGCSVASTAAGELGEGSCSQFTPCTSLKPPPRPSHPPKLSLLIPTPTPSPPMRRGLACSRAVNPSGPSGPSSVSVESPVSPTPSPSTYSSWSSGSSSSSSCSSDSDSRESSPSSSPPSSPSYTPHHASAFQSQNPYQNFPQPQSQTHLPQEPIRRAATPASKLVARTLLLRHTPGHFSRGGYGGACPWGALRAACGGRRYVGSGLRVEVC